MHVEARRVARSIDTSRYPYLVDIASYVRRRYGPVSYEVVLLRRDVVERAFERLEEALREAKITSQSPNPEVEILAFHLGLLLVALYGDRWVISRYALAEAERSYAQLQEEDDDAIELLASLIGVDLKLEREPYRMPIAVASGGVVVYRDYPYSISIFQYVKYAKRLMGDPKWRPINLPVVKGRVYLEKSMAVRLLKEAIMAYVERLAEKIREERPESIPEELSKLIERLRKLVEEARPKPRVLKKGGRIRVRVPKGVIVEEAFPPCMKEIVDKARRGEHLSHHERFAIATFLLNLGMDIDRVVDLFRNLPDFNEKVTRYQVEHLAGLRGSGKKYRTYGCEKMKALDLCRGDCGTRSPIQAYYRALAALIKEGKVSAISVGESGEAGCENGEKEGCSGSGRNIGQDEARG